MLCFAAHTGARRSEIMRALIADVDFIGNTVLVREKKRSRGQHRAKILQRPARLGFDPAGDQRTS